MEVKFTTCLVRGFHGHPNSGPCHPRNVKIPGKVFSGLVEGLRISDLDVHESLHSNHGRPPQGRPARGMLTRTFCSLVNSMTRFEQELEMDVCICLYG